MQFRCKEFSVRHYADQDSFVIVEKSTDGNQTEERFSHIAEFLAYMANAFYRGSKAFREFEIKRFRRPEKKRQWTGGYYKVNLEFVPHKFKEELSEEEKKLLEEDPDRELRKMRDPCLDALFSMRGQKSLVP